MDGNMKMIKIEKLVLNNEFLQGKYVTWYYDAHDMGVYKDTSTTNKLLKQLKSITKKLQEYRI
jgi:hypothetical protein